MKYYFLKELLPAYNQNKIYTLIIVRINYKGLQHCRIIISQKFICLKKKKVKWSRYTPCVAQRVGRGTAILFHDRGNRRGWVVRSTPRPQFRPGKTRYAFYRRLGGPQGRSGRAENLVPTGIRSRTAQPIVNRYTDWATRPTNDGCVRTLSIMPEDFRPFKNY